MSGPTRDRLLLTAASALLLLTGLGGLDLWAPDEPRYAAVAEQMRAGNSATDWIVLRLNDEVYTQKPPLYFWLAALAGAPDQRVSELAARLPSALAGIAAVVLTAIAGGRMFGSGSGIGGGALLLTTWLFAHLARRAQLDVLLTALVALALFAAWQLDRGNLLNSGPRRRGLGVMHAAMGLAVLTKGPVGFLVPGAVLVVYLAWERRLRDLRGLFPVWGLAWSLGPGLLWIAAALVLTPAGYFETAVVENLWGRFFQGTSHARPFYYYLYQFPIQFLPWTPLWALVAWTANRRVFARDADPDRARAWRFALSWIGATLLFFSLSSGKRALYLLPAFPAAALLCADAARSWLDERGLPGRPLAIPLAIIGAALALGGLLAPAFAGARDIEIPLGVGLATAVGIAAVAGLWRATRRHANAAWLHAGALWLGALGLELLLFLGYFPALEPEKSPRPIAQLAAQHSEAGEPIGLIGKTSLIGALNYYGGRRVVELSTADGIREFLGSGGRVIVVAEKHLDRVRAVTPLAIHGRSRSGRRALVVVSATPGGGA